MAVGFQVKYFWYSVGNGDFLHAFFSTIAYNLENSSWGSKFPCIMNELYQGEIPPEKAKKALSELKKIKKGLRKFSADKVVWDIEDLSQRPPWGDDISTDITNLSNYFVTSEGEDLIEVLKLALEMSIETNHPIKIESL